MIDALFVSKLKGFLLKTFSGSDIKNEGYKDTKDKKGRFKPAWGLGPYSKLAIHTYSLTNLGTNWRDRLPPNND